MPSISQKGHQMPESPIRKLAPYAEKAYEQGKKVYHLNIGQPDIKTPEIALNAISNHSLEIIAYTNSDGSEQYRKKIVNYYSKHDIHLNHDEIIVTTGGSEALLFAFGSIMDPGDEVIIPEPFYANYSGFTTASGATIVPIVSRIEDNFALPPIADFEKLITPKTKAILICNPGNPTGYLYSKDELKQLSELVRKHDLFLIADEVYREFCYDGAEHFSVMSDDTLHEHAIMIDSVSKRYSMCGARVGCLVSKNKSVISTALKFAQARLSPPTFAQIASEAALETPAEYFSEVIEEYVLRRDILVKGLENIPGVKVAKPKGAFYCVVELLVADTDHFAQWLLSDFDLNGETVMVAPAAGFYVTPGLGKNQVSMAYVLNCDELKKCIQILDQALKVYASL